LIGLKTKIHFKIHSKYGEENISNWNGCSSLETSTRNSIRLERLKMTPAGTIWELCAKEFDLLPPFDHSISEEKWKK
jgi:hypothetical protein